MILEANRAIADWLGHATYGVNALLASTPLDAGDSVPANIATITDETRDGNVARGELPATLPAIVVSADHIKDEDGQVVTITRDGHVTLRIRIGMDNAVTENAVRDLSYYLRTVKRSLRAFFEHDTLTNNRTRNGVTLVSVESMADQIANTKDPAGNVTVSAYCIPTVLLRDNVANQ